MDAMFAETLIANMPDALVYSDRDGAVRYWNHGAEKVFGHTADEAIGQSLDLIIPEGLRARHWTGYQETMRTGRTLRRGPDPVGPGHSQGRQAHLSRLYDRPFRR